VDGTEGNSIDLGESPVVRRPLLWLGASSAI
jgi:hypothetical protein